MKKILLSLCLQAALCASTSFVEQAVYTIRDPHTDSADFRHALESIGEHLAAQIFKELPSKEATVTTLTGKEAFHQVLAENPVLIAILRAGLPLSLGALKVFPEAEVGFFGVARNEDTLQPTTSYVAIPDITDRYVILCDTMIGTGGSMIDVLQILKPLQPKKIFLLSAIASQPGVDRIRDFDASISIFSATVDPKLNDKGYILPGLGDAGDRCYGKKQ